MHRLVFRREAELVQQCKYCHQAVLSNADLMCLLLVFTAELVCVYVRYVCVRVVITCVFRFVSVHRRASLTVSATSVCPEENLVSENLCLSVLIESKTSIKRCVEVRMHF